MFKKCVYLVAGCVGLLAFQENGLADTLDIGLSNELAQVAYAKDFGQGVSSYASLLHADTNHRKANVASLGFFTSQSSGDLTPRMGAKIFLVDGSGSNNSSYGIALAAGTDYVLLPNVILGLDASYAPKVVTGGDFDNYYELSARCGYQMMNSAIVSVGYTKSQATSPSFGVYEGLAVGVKFKF